MPFSSRFESVIQWTPSNPVTLGTSQSVLIREVALFQGSRLEGVQISLLIVAEGGEVCIIERLFSSSLVALVEMSNPRKLRVCHFKKNSEICTYSYPDTILTVKLNRQAC